MSLKPEAHGGKVDPSGYLTNLHMCPCTLDSSPDLYITAFYLGRSCEDTAPSAQVPDDSAMESGCVPKRVQRECLLPMNINFSGFPLEIWPSKSLGGPSPSLLHDEIHD